MTHPDPPDLPDLPAAVGDPDGHGRFGVLDVADDGGLVCHECGRSVRQLATHARRSHDLTAAAYRQRHGLGRTTRMISPDVHEVLSEHANRQVGTDAWHRFEQSRNWEKAVAASASQIRGHQRPAVAAQRATRARKLTRARRTGRVLTCVICGAQWSQLRAVRPNATCGSPACVSAHLSAVHRDRRRFPLTPDQVLEIYRTRNTLSHNEIAQRFDISPATSSAIRNGYSHNSITGHPRRR